MAFRAKLVRIGDVVFGVARPQEAWQESLGRLASARARGDLSSELEDRFAWQVVLGKDRTINAFALPGGWLGVHLGLIAATTTRDELASVRARPDARSCGCDEVDDVRRVPRRRWRNKRGVAVLGHGGTAVGMLGGGTVVIRLLDRRRDRRASEFALMRRRLSLEAAVAVVHPDDKF